MKDAGQAGAGRQQRLLERTAGTVETVELAARAKNSNASEREGGWGRKAADGQRHTHTSTSSEHEAPCFFLKLASDA